MAEQFSDLKVKMTPQSQARAEDQAQAMLTDMPLNEWRQAHGLRQKIPTEVLQVQQRSIVTMKKRTNMATSSLGSHMAAVGGQPEVVARFPDAAFKITHLADLASNPTA